MNPHRLIPLDAPAEWEGALRAMPHGFAHRWEHCYAMHLSTKLPTYLYTFQCGRTQIVCPIAERTICGEVDIVTPYGFSGFAGNQDCPAFPDYWRQFAAERGYVCAYIGLNPLFANATYFRSDEVCTYNSVFALDLTLSEADLFDRLSTNRQRQIRAATTSPCQIVLDKEPLRHFLVQHLNDFFRQKGAASVYQFSDVTLECLLASANLKAVGVATDEGLAAVMVFGFTQDSSDFLFNISTADGKRFSAALLWFGIQWLKARGIPVLNLGGGIRPGDGVAQFKARFGATQKPLQSLKQVFRPVLYRKLCLEAGTDPADRTGYFPAYRQPRCSAPLKNAYAA